MEASTFRFIQLNGNYVTKVYKTENVVLSDSKHNKAIAVVYGSSVTFVEVDKSVKIFKTGVTPRVISDEMFESISLLKLMPQYNKTK